MVRKSLMAGIAAMALVSGYASSLSCSPATAADESKKSDLPKALSFEMKTLEGQAADMKKYAGKVVMFVNVASKCGLTPQYEALQKVYEKYSDKGFVIVGVPCNQFGGQEAGTSKEIRNFCTSNYKVTFDMTEKVNVNDSSESKACPLYSYLTSVDTKPLGKGAVKWNFEKFLLDRKGNVIARFSSRTKPDDAEIISAIEKAIAE